MLPVWTRRSSEKERIRQRQTPLTIRFSAYQRPIEGKKAMEPVSVAPTCATKINGIKWGQKGQVTHLRSCS